MKKLLASVLAAVILIAVFAASASVGSYKAAAYSIDWYLVDGNMITSQGHVDQFVADNKPVYIKDKNDPGRDTVTFFGWVQLEGQKPISAIGYKIDNGAPMYDDNFFSRLTDMEGFHVDRTAELTNAGFKNAEGFVLRFGYAGLSDGEHTASLMVKGDDGVDSAFFTYSFTVAPADTPEPAVIIRSWIDSRTPAEEIAETGIIEIAGWTGANYEMIDIGYAIDYGEPVFGDGSAVIIPVAEDDPVKSTDIGGGQYAERFSIYIDLEEIDITEGVHTLAVYVKVDDGHDTALKIHKTIDGTDQGALVFVYGDYEDHENDVWLCEKADSFTVGWWMYPEGMPDLHEFDVWVSFITPSAFDGFMMACFAGVPAEAAELQISLLDEDDEVLETQQIKVSGDHNVKSLGFVKVYFDKVYAKGTYTIQIILTGGKYFVLASGDHNEMTDMISVYGNNSPQGRDDEHGYVAARSPAVKLLGAEDPGTEDESSEDSTEDPDDTEEVPEVSAKDVNGDGEANNKDVVALFRYVSSGAPYDENYDIDGDEENNNKDVVALFRALSKMETGGEDTAAPEDTETDTGEIIYADDFDTTAALADDPD
jgi:hypothetical protein